MPPSKRVAAAIDGGAWGRRRHCARGKSRRAYRGLAIEVLEDRRMMSGTEPLPDIALGALVWNTLRDMDPFGAWRGVDVTYHVEGQLPPGVELEIAFSWASGPEPENALGDPIAVRRVDPAGGTHTVNDPAFWAPPPAGTSYLLAVADPDDQIEEADEQNNWAALAVHSAAELLASAISVSRIDPYTIQAEFSPGGGQYTLSEAEVVLGVHHFNWIVQSYLPGSMEVQQLLEIGYKILEGHPFLEPATSVSDLARLRLYSPFATPNTHPFASQEVDDNLFYWNEPDQYTGPEIDLDIRNYQSGGSVFFYSSPRVPNGFYGPGEASSFYLRLMGVSVEGQPIDLGNSEWYSWQSNTVYDPAPGDGVWFAADLDDPLPTPVGGGVTRPEMVTVTSLVARRDTAVAGQQGPVTIDVLANDYDPQGAALRLVQLGPARHGTVERDDAGTPDDPTDDRVRYTPNPGFVGDDRFQYVIVRRNGGPGLAIGQVTVHVPGPIVGLAALGDSLSDEYAGESYSYADNWVELLAASGVNVGAWGSYEEPRREGYAYDWARSGATSASLLAQGQPAGVADQAAAGSVNYAVLWVGHNDFSAAFEGIYWHDDPQRGWTPQQIADFTAGVAGNIRSALDILAAAGVHVVLVNLGDVSTLPGVRQYFPDADRRELVTQVVAGLNAELATLAADYRVPLVDMFGLGRVYLGTNASPVESVEIGGQTFWNAAGQDATNLFVADGVHPHTVTQAIFANLMLKALELGYGVDVAEYWRTEEAIVSLAGLPYGGQDTLHLDYAQYVVLPENRAPVGVEDQYTTDEDTLLEVAAASGVLANDRDPDGQELLARLASGAAHGVVTLGVDGSFRYQPEADYHGPDSFTYWLDDGQTAVEVMVQITVRAVNDPPVAAADAYQTDEDTPLAVTPAEGVLANDADAEGDLLSAVLVSGPSHGQLSWPGDGSFMYTPDADYFGPDSFTYRATDGQAESEPMAVSITVHPVNDPPAPGDDQYVVDENTVLEVPAARGLLANDTDAEGDPLGVTLETAPAHGSLVLESDGSFRYTPLAGFAGTDRFTYRTTDGQSSSSPAVVSIHVAGVLGDVDFRRLSGIALAADEAWYRVETTHSGWLTAEASIAGSPQDAAIALYDAGQSLLRTSAASGCTQRLDYEVSAGQTYYVRLFGVSADVDLRLVNLVQRAGAAVTVAGTSQSDPFTFDAAELRLSIHGVSYAFAPGSISSVQFDGNGGDDSAVLFGTIQPEVATLAPGSATLVGPTWSASVVNTPAIVILGRGGDDQVTLYGSGALRDTFTAFPSYATMAGTGYSNRAVGFGQITAFATPGADDLALVFGSAGDDQLEAEAGYARLTDNRSYSITVRDFRSLQAYGGAGENDAAVLRGTPAGEMFTARPEEVALRGRALRLQARGFEQVTVDGGGGEDTARLEGSAGNDRFEARPAEGWATLTIDNAAWRIEGFRSIYALSDGQGNDQARLEDSAGDDTLVAQPGYAMLVGPAGLVRVEGFASVSAISGQGGEDQATLRDSSGDDTLQAWLTAVTLAGPGYFFDVEGFGRINALSTGGSDSATFQLQSAGEVFVGTWSSARLVSNGIEVAAHQFREVTVQGLTSQGWDRAYLYDSPGDDTLVAAGNSVTLDYPDRVIRLLDLSWVQAHSIHGGTDRRRVEAIDFILSTAGSWLDL